MLTINGKKFRFFSYSHPPWEELSTPCRGQPGQEGGADFIISGTLDASKAWKRQKEVS